MIPSEMPKREILTSAPDGDGVIHAFYPSASRTLCNQAAPPRVKGWPVRPTCEECVTTGRAWHRIDSCCPPHWHGLQVLKEAAVERLGPDVAASSSTTRPVGRPAQWTRESVIAAIQQWAADHDGVPPKSTEWKLIGSGRPSTNAVISYFGRWSAAIEAAGLDPTFHLTPQREARHAEGVVAVVRTRFAAIRDDIDRMERELLASLEDEAA